MYTPEAVSKSDSVSDSINTTSIPTYNNSSKKVNSQKLLFLDPPDRACSQEMYSLVFSFSMKNLRPFHY